MTQIPHKHSMFDTETTFVPSVNINPATEFGELEIMFPPRTSFHVSRELTDQCWEKLVDFNPEIDSILPMGDMFIGATCCAILGKRFNHFFILKWDKNLGRYLKSKVII